VRLFGGTPAGEQVDIVPGPPGQRVIADPTRQRVGAVAAEQGIHVGAAVEEVAVRAATQGVVADAAQEAVGAGSALQTVRTGQAPYRVVPDATVGDVRDVGPGDLVGPVISEELVLSPRGRVVHAGPGRR